jgi:hypothetical protein
LMSPPPMLMLVVVNYNGMLFVTMCHPEYYETSFVTWMCPHPKLFFHTNIGWTQSLSLDGSGWWNAIFHPQRQSPNDWITCRVEGEGIWQLTSAHGLRVNLRLLRERERERVQRNTKRLYFLKLALALFAFL